MEIQKQGRYCRYHEAPQRLPQRSRWAVVASWLESLVRGFLIPREQEGRKRILPGYDNTNLGAGWHRVEPKKRPVTRQRHGQKEENS